MNTRSKYNNKKVEVNGYVFDSLAEAARYRELCLLQRAGRISGLEVHPKFLLQKAFKDRAGKTHRAIYYEADFKYLESGVEAVEDVKGASTQVYLIKAKLFRFIYQQYDYRVIRA